MSFNDSARLNQMISSIESDLKFNHLICRVRECEKLNNSSINNFKINIYSIKKNLPASLYRFGFVYLCNQHNFSDVEKSLSLSQIFVEDMLFEGKLNDSINFLKKFSLLY